MQQMEHLYHKDAIKCQPVSIVFHCAFIVTLIYQVVNVSPDGSLVQKAPPPNHLGASKSASKRASKIFMFFLCTTAINYKVTPNEPPMTCEANRGFHKMNNNDNIAILILMSTLCSHIFAVFSFIVTTWC